MTNPRFIAIIIGFLLLFPLNTSALSLTGTTLPFGGMVSFTIPCTCPGSIGNFWIWFTPLFLGSPAPLTGSLVYVPYITTLYSWFMIGTPSTWHLGNFTPGTQACWMLIPPPGTGCFPLLSAGVITEVGTSKLF